MKKNIIAIALLSALSATAMAEGMYATADIGQSTVVDACAGAAAFGVTCDEAGMAFRFGGGYQLNEKLAIEASYGMLASVKASFGGSSAEIKPSALQISAVGTLPINQEISLVGKVGLSRISADMSATGFATESTTTTGMSYGFGAQYNISDKMGIRAQYENLGKVNDTADDYDVTMFSAGVVFKF